MSQIAIFCCNKLVLLVKLQAVMLFYRVTRWHSGKESACQFRRHGFERAPGEGNGSPLKCSCLENPMDRVAWCAVVHTVAKSRTQLKQLSTHTKSFRQGSDQPYFTNIISTSYFTNISTSYFINIGTNLWNRLIGGKIWHRISGEKTFAIIQVRDNGGLIRWGREENGWAISEIINSS